MMLSSPQGTPALDQSAAEAHGAASRRRLDTSRFPARARMALSLLERLRHGVLSVTFPDGQRASWGAACGSGPHAEIRLRDWSVCDAALRSGDIGFAETYIDGAWDTGDLTALLGLFIANRDEVESFFYGTWWGRLLYRVRHLLNRNSRTGSRRNIHAHYDIGNAFYRLWLDPTMTYSSALFAEAETLPSGHPNDHPDAPQRDDSAMLADAQSRKYRRILDELRARPGQQLLEIGCGWGGFAEAALDANVHVTGLTLSTEQLAWARERCDTAATRPGIDARADLRLQDYRDCGGQFDGITSIEMFEAVGEAYWPDYFNCLKRNLKPGGRACVQTIVIDDALFERYRKSTDFIQQYIFPGGMLPSPGAFHAQAESAGLKIVNSRAFGQDYARTLRVWHQRFIQELPAIRAQNFDERFIRTWSFYLCYCEAAFLRANTDVIQFTLEHAD